MDTDTQQRSNSRNNNNNNNNGENSPKTVMMRALLTKKEAGVIIGRNGANVHTIRSKTNARVNLTDNFPGCTERVATVVGPVENVAHAFELMALMLAGVEGNNVTQTVPSAVTMRLLIPNNHMGSIIGKGGAKIKEIQNASSVRLNAQEHPLPASTERQVNAVGLPDGIKIAITDISSIIMNYSERNQGTLYYRPQMGITATMSGLGAATSAQAAAVLANPAAASSLNPYGYNPAAMMAAPGAAQLGRAGSLAAAVGSLGAAATQAQQIFIPNDLVGAIIGKGGAKINEIRQMSGASIKINEPDGNVRERLVTITGTAEANQMALYLLYNRLEVEKQRIYGAANTNAAAQVSAGRF
ncbi:hypothetical protein THASP1DRAFT_12379 [Thamnocephalis sphaerospora]|uniref:K Homology domain-containing protein n=1 Tax=Thamnocephalis sphaerospora TaxID=78915 RepID=A0A4P9XWN7_9FUNG|nr:hypothetical protein THASP1DRAFT_12379 [Thamnocephalis sphaerospora]|eukprot:RKP10795.1 hypothetical protein THASP1DRAFT_12379 [Thamnocephalis sphaerospora]